MTGFCDRVILIILDDFHARMRGVGQIKNQKTLGNVSSFNFHPVEHDQSANINILKKKKKHVLPFVLY